MSTLSLRTLSDSIDMNYPICIKIIFVAVAYLYIHEPADLSKMEEQSRCGYTGR
jgi:hypothetical protein